MNAPSITIRTDDDLGPWDDGTVDRRASHFAFRAYVEHDIETAYPGADVRWETSWNTTGVSTRVSADTEEIEDAVETFINNAWPAADEWLVPRTGDATA